jgi:M-phase inducer tyrosine phosphatase
MKSSCDYFTLKPVRGLSPTTSLAADLSQNFHIEQRYVVSFCPRLFCQIVKHDCACFE